MKQAALIVTASSSVGSSDVVRVLLEFDSRLNLVSRYADL
jgi:hypothetical protein